MKKVKSISIFTILLLAIAVLLLPCWSNINFESKAINQTNDCFEVEVFGRSGSKITITESTNYQHGTMQSNLQAFAFEWKDVEKFVFRVDPTSYSPTADENNAYTTHITIEFLKGYKETPIFNQAALKTIEDYDLFSRTSVGDYYGITSSSPELYLDEGIDATAKNGEQVNISGWGIYRFILQINSGKYVYSDFFIIEPVKETYQQPTIVYEEQAPNLEYLSYVFSLSNADDFKYIDTSRLIWYVTGQAQGGIKYVLTNEDRNNFPEYERALFPSKDRTGFTFTFDDQGNHGEWNVWCEYQYFQSEAEPAKSNIITLVTTESNDLKIFIWVIVSIVVVSIVATIAICLFKIKREKVY